MWKTSEEHVTQVVAETSAEMRAKYTAGQVQHGGRLWQKRGLLAHAIEEADDQAVYLRTLRHQIPALAHTLADLAGCYDALPDRQMAIEQELRHWLLEPSEEP
ncbi:MAG: hypothetical protein PHR30_16610 [Gallionellaceae bacterium]|nr:hypothetical protein [Gallionellaceae bacterium]